MPMALSRSVTVEIRSQMNFARISGLVLQYSTWGATPIQAMAFVDSLFAKTGQPILVHGHVLDKNSRGIAGILIAFWEAGGQYWHEGETYRAPPDPNFRRCGRVLTDEQDTIA